MNDLLAFAAVSAVLLAVPGPTNALLATAGATRGVAAGLRLIPFVLAGYAVAIGGLLGLVAPIAAVYSLVELSIKLAAVAYLLWLAAKLWRGVGPVGSRVEESIQGRDLFLTTLLNPKGLILAFVVFPGRAGGTLLVDALVFAVLVAICGGGWVLLGGALKRITGGDRSRRVILRLSAVVLATFAVAVAISVF